MSEFWKASYKKAIWFALFAVRELLMLVVTYLQFGLIMRLQHLKLVLNVWSVFWGWHFKSYPFFFLVAYTFLLLIITFKIDKYTVYYTVK